MGVRRCDPKKVETLRNWPEPQSRDDVVSFRAYCNYLKEFIPGYHDMELHLREYTKQGVDFKRYAQDKKAQAAFVAL